MNKIKVLKKLVKRIKKFNGRFFICHDGGLNARKLVPELKEFGLKNIPNFKASYAFTYGEMSEKFDSNLQYNERKIAHIQGYINFLKDRKKELSKVIKALEDAIKNTSGDVGYTYYICHHKAKYKNTIVPELADFGKIYI